MLCRALKENEAIAENEKQTQITYAYFMSVCDVAFALLPMVISDINMMISRFSLLTVFLFGPYRTMHIVNRTHFPFFSADQIWV